MSLTLSHLQQCTNDVANHMRQESVCRNPNLEHCRELGATGSDSRPDLPAIAVENRPRGSPPCCRSPRPWNAFAATHERREIVGSHELLRTGSGRFHIQFSSPYPGVAAEKRAADRGCNPVAIFAPNRVVPRTKRFRANGHFGCADVNWKTCIDRTP